MEVVINRVAAWQALDSRGTPTVGCAVYLSDGAAGRAIVPSGASTGSHDAREHRDGGRDWDGLGVRRSVARLTDEIGPALADTAPDQVDAWLDDADPTPDLSQIGVHAALAISVAGARAAAMSRGVALHELLAAGEPRSLPRPMVNVVSGGAHAGTGPAVQDILVVPLAADTFADAIEIAWKVRRRAAALAADAGTSGTLVADEGGIALPAGTTDDALRLVTQAIEHAGLAPGDDAGLAIDVAANQLWDGDRYRLDGTALSVSDLVDEIASWTRMFPVMSVEDPVRDDDWEGWTYASERLGHGQLLGDDLFATSATRIREAATRGVGNAVLVKPNQRGTLARAWQAMTAARDVGYATVVSARSGDTEDDWLADLAVGWNAGQIKVGSTTRSERTAKWNRLLQIEAENPMIMFSQPRNSLVD